MEPNFSYYTESVWKPNTRMERRFKSYTRVQCGLVIWLSCNPESVYGRWEDAGAWGRDAKSSGGSVGCVACVQRCAGTWSIYVWRQQPDEGRRAIRFWRMGWKFPGLGACLSR